MKNSLTFWGTRGSFPVSGSKYKFFGGNTPCLEVRYEDALAIIDAGTGIRPLGEKLIQENIKNIHLFLSHTHWDHMMGFLFFAPIHQQGVHVTIWAPKGDGRSCIRLFEEMFAKEFFPIRLHELQATLEFREIQEKTPIALGSFELDFHKTMHPGVTFGFKIKTQRQTIGYVTDNELSNEQNLTSFVEFYKNSDLFIHEAQYSSEEYLQKKGWGHSPFMNAVSLIEKIRPKKWLVTHHDPQHTDQELRMLCKETKKQLKEKKINCPLTWVFDGYQIGLL